MSKLTIKNIVFTASLIFMVVLVACEKDENDILLINGKVVFMPPPDNCNDFVIKTDDDQLFKPANLAAEYMVDDLSISFAYKATNENHNCNFGGSIPIINLTRIKAR